MRRLAGEEMKAEGVYRTRNSMVLKHGLAFINYYMLFKSSFFFLFFSLANLSSGCEKQVVTLVLWDLRRGGRGHSSIDAAAIA